MWILASVVLGFLLDLLLGDPHWMPHPVVYMGKAIVFLEKQLCKHATDTPEGKRRAGVWLAILLPTASFVLSSLVLYLAYRLSIWLWFGIHTFWVYQILASRCLAQESSKVYHALEQGDLPQGRMQLSYLVGRETANLSEEEVVKACVETVAENTTDGVTAPLFYLLLGGVPLGFFYKAGNTLDSMVGYRNEKYLDFGRASAKLDDGLNWLPSRLCGCMMILSSRLLGLDYKNAWRTFRRDRNKHLSPNSAQTESVAAGALGIQLGGSHVYFGNVVEKPTIGVAKRHAERQDIRKANRLMLVTAGLSLVIFGAVRFLLGLVLRVP